MIQHADGGGPLRAPAWQWVGFGVGAILAAWVPLTTLAIGAARGAMRWLDLDKSFPLILTLVGVGSLAAIVAGAVAGGYVVGRWGPRRPVLLGALSGLIAGALAGILNAIVTRTPVALWVAVPGVAVAASSAGVGAWTGARVRAASPGGAEIVQDD